MNENKADLDNSRKFSNPYLIQNQLEFLLISSKFSDVSFLVEGEVICAHKFPLVMSSPVFEKMFYGDLKMDTSKPIEITDMTAIGFKNMLKYIYTNKIEFELQYFYETYLAADKYLVHHMNDALIDYLILDLNKSNCCLIYDQLINFQNVNLLQLDNVKKMIIDNTEKAFESDDFIKIQPTTLISILNFDELSIFEMDLLKAIWKYVNDNVNNLENDSSKESKRKFFEQFKGFIRFDRMNPADLVDFDYIDDLLNIEEIGLLLLHLHKPKKRPLNLKCLTKRTNGLIKNVSFNCNEEMSSRSIEIFIFKVDQNVNVEVIHTTISSSLSDFDFVIRDAQNIDLKLQFEKFDLDNQWSFKFKDFKVQKNTVYKLDFYLRRLGDFDYRMSGQNKIEFEIDDKKINFYLDDEEPNFNHHFIKQIDFSIP